MRRASFIILPLLLSACGGTEESSITETRMDDIDSMQGTISDEMVNSEALNEQPLVEASPLPGAKPKAKPVVESKADRPAPAAPPETAPAPPADEG